MRKAIVFLFCSIFLLSITVPGLSATKSIDYSKTWGSTGSDELKIDIAPIPSTYQPNKIYTFNIRFTAVSFRSNQDRFHTIYVQMRLVTPQKTITSDQNGAYEIDTLGGTISISLNLVLPDQSQFGLSAGKSISASLEYKIDFKLGLILEIDPSYTSNWDSVSTSSVGVPSQESSSVGLFIIGGLLILTVFIGVFIFIAIRQKSHSPPNQVRPPYPPNQSFNPNYRSSNAPPPTSSTFVANPPPVNPQGKIRFCNNCGHQLSNLDKFCPSCGQGVTVY